MRDSDHYGKYGKIAKMFLSRRSTATGGFTHPHQQPVNVYINFVRPQDAAACIAAVDNSTTDDGVELRASWGTTKYCTAFLRGQKCLSDSCQQAHELGEEVDSSSERARQDMATLCVLVLRCRYVAGLCPHSKHAMKESEHRTRPLDAKRDGAYESTWARIALTCAQLPACLLRPHGRPRMHP